MSQNEKLRTLLAEARQLVGFLPTYPAGFDLVSEMRQRIDAALAEPRKPTSLVHRAYHAQVVEQLTQERDEARARCEKLRELADMAAAEQGLAQRRMMEAQKERDEALAEAVRLRGLFDTTRHQTCRSLGASDSIGWASVLMEISQTRSNNNMLLRERDEARAALADAYRRGAEAMKRAAVAACEEEARTHEQRGFPVGVSWAIGATLAAACVEALPIPEDK